MRRENGTGTITKLSGKRNRPYMAKYPTETYDDKGHMKYMTVGYYKTRKEAYLALAEYMCGLKRVKLNDYTWENLSSHWTYHPLSDIIMEDVVNPIKKSLKSLKCGFDDDYENYFRPLGYRGTDFRILELINKINTKEDLLAFLIGCIYHTCQKDKTSFIDGNSIDYALGLIPDELKKKGFGFDSFHRLMSKPFGNHVMTWVRFKDLGKSDVNAQTEFMYMVEKIAMDMICTMRTFVPKVIKDCKILNQPTMISRIERDKLEMEESLERIKHLTIPGIEIENVFELT